MAINQGPKIASSNIVLSYDFGDIKNSYLGEPTTNSVYYQNPRIDTSYSPYIVGSHTNWLGMHPGAITVYNQDNNELSSYVNTGITVANSGVDWTQARHAYWVYDEELKRPVVQMYNAVSTWQAKSYGTNMNAWSTYGYGVGTQYTISWNQWVTNTSMRANVGMYTRNSGGSYNFWDGLSSASSTSTNTKTHTWERVYHTFTVTSNWDQTNSYGAIYMYGMDYGSGHILRIADVQLDIKNHPTQFCNALTRSNIYDNLRDQTRSSNAFYTDLSYTTAAVPQPIFDGTNDYLNSGLSGTDMTNFSIECWFNASSISAYRNVFDMNYTSYITASVANVGPRLEFNGSTINSVWSGNTGNNNLYNGSSAISVSTNTWYHYVMTGAAGSMRFYLNGTLQNTLSSAQGYPTRFGDVNIGRGFALDASRVFFGRIPVFKIYTKVLTDNQVYNNYVALRSRFT